MFAAFLIPSRIGPAQADSQTGPACGSFRSVYWLDELEGEPEDLRTCGCGLWINREG
jgi:hypothetical protein